MKSPLKLPIAAANGRWSILIAVLLLAAFGAAYAQDAAPPPELSALKQTVQAALQAEKTTLSSLEKSYEDQQKNFRDLTAEVDLKKIQLSTMGNLLLTPEVRIDDLEKAWLSIRNTIEQLDGRLAELKEKVDSARKLEGQLREQQAFAEQQLATLKAAESPAPDARALIGDIQTLIRSQAQRVEILEDLQTGYLDLIARIDETRQGFSDLTEKFSQGIRDRKREDLFQ